MSDWPPVEERAFLDKVEKASKKLLDTNLVRKYKDALKQIAEGTNPPREEEPGNQVHGAL